jgi:hypothetical protein
MLFFMLLSLLRSGGSCSRKNQRSEKILDGMGFEPATLGIESAVTDYSATNVTVPKGCCWVLMGCG